MKVRDGFVSNSSSSSFSIKLRDLTGTQVGLIMNHSRFTDGLEPASTGWYVELTTHKITGRTDMDNFNMYDFLDEIGVDMNNITWSY